MLISEGSRTDGTEPVAPQHEQKSVVSVDLCVLKEAAAPSLLYLFADGSVVIATILLRGESLTMSLLSETWDNFLMNCHVIKAFRNTSQQRDTQGEEIKSTQDLLQPTGSSSNMASGPSRGHHTATIVVGGNDRIKILR